MGVQVLVTRLDPDLPLPRYAKGGDAGADIVSRIDVVLAPGERTLVPTGISIALPDGYVALVHPRSGLAIKHGVTMVNAPGTVDAGYRGELQVILINHDALQFTTESCIYCSGSIDHCDSMFDCKARTRVNESHIAIRKCD